MNIEQLKKAISEAFEKAAEEAAEKILEECPRKEVKEEPEPRVPKNGELYYRINEFGGLGNYEAWENDGFDNAALRIGNVFCAEEEAKKALDWLKARKVLFDDTKGFKPDWRDTEQRKWSVCYDCVEDEDEDEERLYSAFNAVVNDTPGPYFATKGDADLSIIEHRKEWLVYLGVEE